MIPEGKQSKQHLKCGPATPRGGVTKADMTRSAFLLSHGAPPNPMICGSSASRMAHYQDANFANPIPAFDKNEIDHELNKTIGLGYVSF